MTLHVLIVEDDASFASAIAELVSELPGTANVQIAESRSSAMEIVARDHFDLVILDLKIPSTDGGLDSDPSYGHEVFERIRAMQPGVAILVLTGSPVERFVQRMLDHSTIIDIWSDGTKRPTVQFVQKLDIDTVPALLAALSSAVAGLADVELEASGLNLSVGEDRLIRIFAKKYGGVRCKVKSLKGGLSGVAVYQLQVTDAHGARVHDAVVKIAPQEVIDDEESRYDQSVTRLAGGATPRMLVNISYGGGLVAGIFYSLAEGHSDNGFALAERRSTEAPAVIAAVEAATANWRIGVGETRKKIGDIRRTVMSDARLDALKQNFDLNWTVAFEQTEIQCRWCVVHGDMHGANVLLDASGNAVLIDFGNVEANLASLDPVMLELSVLFHSDGLRPADWPSLDQLRRWGDVEQYIVGSPCADLVRACRVWAGNVAAGRREIGAAAYVYVLQQLRYEDTDKDRAMALLEGVRNLYQET